MPKRKGSALVNDPTTRKGHHTHMILLTCLLVYVVVWLTAIGTQYVANDIIRRQKEMNR